MTRAITLAAAIVLVMSSAIPVFAQGTGGGAGGDNSLTTGCKANLDRQQLAVAAEKDPAKQAAANVELTAAKDAMTKGDQTGCLAHLQKIDAALK